jgi:hypothetical protein
MLAGSGANATVTDNVQPSGAQQNGPGCLEWCGDPWGSWGYDKSSAGSYGRMHVGYAHTYAKRNDVTSVCVNFYDVHGGDKVGGAKFQLPNGSKEIDVLGNGDNSIQTNSFIVNGGSCFTTRRTELHDPQGTADRKQTTYTTSEAKTEVGKKVEYKITVMNTGNTTIKNSARSATANARTSSRPAKRA